MITADAIRCIQTRRLGRFNSSQTPTTCATSSKRKSNGVHKTEKHKIFDEAIITVKGGNGGNGQIVQSRGGKYVRNFKYNPGGNSPKRIWLPHSDPADGGDGGDVVIYCDPSKDSLLEFHEKMLFTAKKGIQGDPEEGTQAPKSLTKTKRIRRKAKALKIGVPPGTIIKRKGTGHLLGEIVDKRDELVVARGGQGGHGVTQPSKKKPTSRRVKGIDYIEREDVDWRKESKGQPGEELTLHLLLRLVADVGFVGLPNVGKSSLLKMLTKAQPQVAAYPFTTLIPNLGVMGLGGDPILVDLPGLIEGAHVGKGLGKNFLRHLRRTRVLLHVVDVSQSDPGADYESIRLELWMYNPQYCHRPHIIALNMIDKIEESSLNRIEEISTEIKQTAKIFQDKDPEASLPIKIIHTSALSGIGIEELRKTLQEVIESQNEKELDSKNKDDNNNVYNPNAYDPSW